MPPHVELKAKLNRTREFPDYDIFAADQLVAHLPAASNIRDGILVVGHQHDHLRQHSRRPYEGLRRNTADSASGVPGGVWSVARLGAGVAEVGSKLLRVSANLEKIGARQPWKRPSRNSQKDLTLLIDRIERIMSTTVTAGTAACVGLTIIFAIVLSGCSELRARKTCVGNM
jgi:hypothetical protein